MEYCNDILIFQPYLFISNSTVLLKCRCWVAKVNIAKVTYMQFQSNCTLLEQNISGLNPLFLWMTFITQFDTKLVKSTKNDLWKVIWVHLASCRGQDCSTCLYWQEKRQYNMFLIQMSVLWLSVSKYCIHKNIFHRHTSSLTSVNGPRRIQEGLQSITHTGSH